MIRLTGSDKEPIYVNPERIFFVTVQNNETIIGALPDKCIKVEESVQKVIKKIKDVEC